MSASTSSTSTSGPHTIPTPTRPTRPLPTRAAPKPITDSLPNTTIITQSTDLCPICKDPFLVNTQAKTLPCTHFYHSHCILPWLQINSSCPLCRFELPSQEENVVVTVGVEEEESYAAFFDSMTLHMERVRMNNRVYETGVIDQDFQSFMC